MLEQVRLHTSSKRWQNDLNGSKLCLDDCVYMLPWLPANAAVRHVRLASARIAKSPLPAQATFANSQGLGLIDPEYGVVEQKLTEIRGEFILHSAPAYPGCSPCLSTLPILVIWCETANKCNLGAQSEAG